MPGAAAGAAASAYASASVTSFAAAAGVSAGTAAVYAGAYAVTALALSAGLSAASAALMGKPKLPTDQNGRKFVVRDSAGPRSILYGEVIVSGLSVYANQRPASSGSSALDMAIAIAGHEVSEISDVWFNERMIPYAAIGGGAAAGGEVGTGGGYDGKYRPRDGESVARINKYLGTDDQAADDALVDYYPDEWSTDHRLRGVAYCRITLRRNMQVYDQGAPGNYRFRVKGAKVYDPRKDTTNGGSGTHRIADPSTWEWSNNPALCVADYLIGGTITNTATRVNLRGFGADPDDVDWASVITAANVCDESVTVPSGDSPASTTQVRYTCDGVLSSGESCAENLERLLTCMLGQLVYTGGKYHLYAGAYQAPTLTLDEDDLAGPIAYATGSSRAERYNAVKGVRWDSTNGQEVEFLPKTSATYELADGGQRLYRDIDLPFTTDEYRAQRIAQVILLRSREQQLLTWRGNLGCLRVGVWETVSVTVAELGLSSKVFRCIKREVTTGEDGPVVELTLREENSSTYTDPILADYDDTSPALPQDPEDDAVAAPTAFVVAGISGGIQFTITAPDDINGTNVVYDIAEYSDATPVESATVIWSGNATAVAIPYTETSPLHSGYFWVRARRNSIVSDWFPSGNGTFGQALASGAGPPGESGVTGYVESDGPLVWVRSSDGSTWTPSGTTLDLDATFTQGSETVARVGHRITRSAAGLLTGAPVAHGSGDLNATRITVTELGEGTQAMTLKFAYSHNGLTALASETVSTSVSGAPAVTVQLTRPAITLVAYADGTVQSYSSANGYLQVFSAGTDITSDAGVVLTVTGQAGCTGTILNAAAGGFAKGYYSVTNMSSDVATLALRAAYGGVNYDVNFTLSKALAGYQSVAVLPTTNLFEGRVVYLTTDGQLYRYHTGAWTTAVPAGSITGYIVANQIQTGTITAAQMQAGTITAVSGIIGTAAITSANIVDLAVDTIKIASGALTTGSSSGAAGTAASHADWFTVSTVVAEGSAVAMEGVLVTAMTYSDVPYTADDPPRSQGDSVQVRLRRATDGVIIGAQYYDVSGNSPGRANTSVWMDTSPPALASITYQLQIRNTVAPNGGTFSVIGMTATGMKR